MTEPITDERNWNRRCTTLRTVGVAKDTRLRGAVAEKPGLIRVRWDDRLERKSRKVERR